MDGLGNIGASKYKGGSGKPSHVDVPKVGARVYDRVSAEERTQLLKNGVDKSGKSGIIKSDVKINMQFFAEKDIEKQESNSLKRAIRNYNKRIKEHEEYIKNPYEHCPEWDNYEERKKNGLIRHWEKEISNFEKSIEDRIKELKKRGDYDE